MNSILSRPQKTSPASGLNPNPNEIKSPFSFFNTYAHIFKSSLFRSSRSSSSSSVLSERCLRTPSDAKVKKLDLDPALASVPVLAPVPVPVPKDLDDLVRLLHLELGSNGLDSQDVNVERVQQLMANYTSNNQDWAKYALFDKGRYTRNLVDDGNGKFNLMILAWPETIGSAIHDHSGSHCLMKVLDGELKETLYHWPEKIVSESVDHPDSGVGSDHSDDDDNGNDNEANEANEANVKVKPAAAMKVKKETFLQRDTVAYMHDQLGLHAVSNPLQSQGSVSLHLYTPPYETCKTFNERSSKARSSGKCVFFSLQGQRVESCSSPEYLKCSLTNNTK